MSTKDFAALKKLSEIQQANYFGNADNIQRGVIKDVMGFDMMRDQQVPVHTAGTVTDTPSVSGAFALGATSITIDCTGGTDAIDLKQGDLVEFGDGKKYSVQADVAITNGNSGAIVIEDRGLQLALSGGETLALVSGFASSVVNLAGDPMGMSMVARRPETNIMGIPTQGMHFPITDPKSGYTLNMAMVGQWYQGAIFCSSIWGVDVTDDRRLCRVLSYTDLS